jgi:hypothetical protein
MVVLQRAAPAPVQRARATRTNAGTQAGRLGMPMRSRPACCPLSDSFALPLALVRFAVRTLRLPARVTETRTSRSGLPPFIARTVTKERRLALIRLFDSNRTEHVDRDASAGAGFTAE